MLDYAFRFLEKFGRLLVADTVGPPVGPPVGIAIRTLPTAGPPVFGPPVFGRGLNMAMLVGRASNDPAFDESLFVRILLKLVLLVFGAEPPA